jgi:pimeloyl-ACP methyl ester carboxylesterase
MPEVPTLVCLHALGSSRRSFDAVTAALADRFDVLALDLPGFGDRPPSEGTTVAEMVDLVVAQVGAHLRSRPGGWGRWLLVGHSMGGKIASIVAARTLSGSAPLFGLAGIVLLAASPPTPEPMADQQRAEMLAWATDGPLDAEAARAFVDSNVGAPLPADLDAAVRADLLRASSEGWRSWLQRGSREDWSAAVGALPLPALVLAGDADEDLGAGPQRAVHGQVYPLARWQVLTGAGHLLPQERPAEVAAAIVDFWTGRAGHGPAVPPASAAAIASPHTSARTRGALAGRALADDPNYTPQALTDAQLRVLRAVADRVVPQDGPPIDLAARIDTRLAAGAGDGWRFADLPPDHTAHRLALDALSELPSLPAGAQDDLLARVAAGDGPAPAGGLTPEQLAQWFLDASDDLVRAWLAHPANLDRVGFDGYAGGGDGPRLQGFTLLSLGTREAWEPVGAADVASATGATSADVAPSAARR